ncbi:uncharacterized protein LOC134911334 isoform X2 [Pseudophryne corroboree]|uniref:uncharacterized protein LOC134911334 isoform X2 n=1 Tax=Pseudophryne corroboree TaxID=495146 RepID=UPI003081294D
MENLQDEDTTGCMELSHILAEVRATTYADMQYAEIAEEHDYATCQPVREEYSGPTAEQGDWSYRHTYEDQNYMACMHLSQVLERGFAAVTSEMQYAEIAEEPDYATCQPVREEYSGPTAEQGDWSYRHTYEDQNYMAYMHLSQVLERGFAAVTSEMQRLSRRVKEVADNMKDCSDSMSFYAPRSWQEEMLSTLPETNTSLPSATHLLRDVTVNHGHCPLDPCNATQDSDVEIQTDLSDEATI